MWRTRPPLLGKALVPPRWCAGGCVTRRGQDPAFIRRLGASSGARGRQGWTAAVSLLCRPGGARGAGARPSTGLRVRGHEGPLRTFAGVASRPLRWLRRGHNPTARGLIRSAEALRGDPRVSPEKGGASSVRQRQPPSLTGRTGDPDARPAPQHDDRPADSPGATSFPGSGDCDVFRSLASVSGRLGCGRGPLSAGLAPRGALLPAHALSPAWGGGTGGPHSKGAQARRPQGPGIGGTPPPPPQSPSAPRGSGH